MAMFVLRRTFYHDVRTAITAHELMVEEEGDGSIYMGETVWALKVAHMM